MEKYKLQRKQIQGKLIKPLLTNLKRLCAGVLIANTIMLAGCTSVHTDEAGAKVFTNTSWLNEIDQTEDYYLLKLNNQIHLAKIYNSLSWDSWHLKAYCNINTGEVLGVTVETKPLVLNSDNFKTSLKDNGGEYEQGKIIPRPAVISLTEFISSEYPSQNEIDFWKSNTEQVEEQFNTYCPKDVTMEITDVFGNNKKQESYAICYYECTQENGDLVKLVGYRSSYSPDDTGYNYVYNILDGQIYYIGEYSEDCFTDVLECTIEDAGNISIEEIIELYKINSQEPLYGNKKDKVQTIKRVTPKRK